MQNSMYFILNITNNQLNTPKKSLVE